jgi:DNA helicase HerA-like ATPase
MKLKSGDVFVIDIAMLPTVEEQGFVVGDVMKSIDQVYSARRTAGKSPPKTLLIFIDEINRFVPRQQPGSQVSPVTDQIMRAVVAGRSRGTILFSAQQFKSAVNPSFHENVGMHVIAKLGASELSTSPDSTKMNIVRLNKGELVMVHPAFRHPIKVIFPKTA